VKPTGKQILKATINKERRGWGWGWVHPLHPAPDPSCILFI